MEERNIEIKVLINFEEYLKLNYKVGLKQLKFILIPITFILLCIISTGLYILTAPGLAEQNTKPLIFLGSFLAVLIFILVFLPISIFLNSKRNFKNMPFLKEEISYIFSQDGIKTKGDSFENKSAWNMIARAQEVAGFFLLYNTNVTSIPIPLRCFRDELQIKEFRKLVREKPGDKAKLK